MGLLQRVANRPRGWITFAPTHTCSSAVVLHGLTVFVLSKFVSLSFEFLLYLRTRLQGVF